MSPLRSLRRAVLFRVWPAAPLAALGTVAFVLSSCAGVTPVAMTINGREISRDEIQREVEVRAKATESVVSDGKYDAGLVAKVMNDRLIREVFDQAVLTVKPKKTAVATDVSQQIEERLKADFGGEKGVKLLSRTYQQSLRNSYVNQIQLFEHYKAASGTPEQYFKTHAAEFGPACVTHLLVGTLDEAVQARARIVGGEPFADVARAVTLDEGTKAAGGDLGCNDVAGFVAPFATAARALKINELSQPVQTQFGFHILKVTKREAAEFNKLAVDQRIGQLADDSMVSLLTEAKVTVNPALGTYIPASGEAIPRIAAPNTPIPADGVSSP